MRPRGWQKPVLSSWKVDTRFDFWSMFFFLSAIFFETGNLSIRHVRTLLHYNCRQLGAVQAEWTWMCRCQLNPCRLEDLIIHGNHALSPQWMHSTQFRWFFMLFLPLPLVVFWRICRRVLGVCVSYLKYHLLLQLDWTAPMTGFDTRFRRTVLRWCRQFEYQEFWSAYDI